MTPWEKVFIEVPEEHAGVVIQKMGIRHANLVDMYTVNKITFLEFDIATKELVGFRLEFLTDTRGLGIINTMFSDFKPDTVATHQRDHGSLVAHETGETRIYGIVNVQDRGILFVSPGERVYKGQVVGRNSRVEDIRVNVCKEKKLSNMRSKGDGTSEHVNSPLDMSLENSLEYIDDSELVEVTPKSVRIRKIILDEIEERRLRSLNRAKEAAYA
jgi:GTP-binding protein